MSEDGKRIAIGAMYYKGTGSNSGYAGQVRVFQWKNSSWEKMGTQFNGINRLGENFSLSGDGNTLAIHDKYDSKAKIYTWNGSTWSQIGNISTVLVVDGYDTNRGAGIKLNYDGTKVIIGEKKKDVLSIYTYSGNSWGSKKEISNVDGERFANDVSLSKDGNTLAISVDSSVVGSSQSLVRIYSWNGSSWVQKGEKIIGEYSLGDALKLNDDGSIIIIGTPRANVTAGNYSGKVSIYKWKDSKWSQLGNDIEAQESNDYTGKAVSISGDGKLIAVGSPNHDSKKGNVRLYYWNNTSWLKLGDDNDGAQLYSSKGGDDGERKGISVALSGFNGNYKLGYGSPGYEEPLSGNSIVSSFIPRRLASNRGCGSPRLFYYFQQQRDW